MIGIVDSGLGGLSTLLAIRKEAPRADLLYLADQAHAPYGEHSPKELCAYFEEILSFFQDKGVEALCVACGTLSAVALPAYKAPLPFPVFEVTGPAVKAAAEQTKTGVAILATTASIRSGVFRHKLLDLGVPLLSEQACPLLVPLLEEGFSSYDLATKEVLKKYLSPFIKTKCDTLLLGCTHYGFLAPAIKEIWPSVELVDSGKALAAHTLSQLSPLKGQGKTLYYTTGAPQEFLKKTSALLRAPHLTVYGAWAKGFESKGKLWQITEKAESTMQSPKSWRLRYGS